MVYLKLIFALAIVRVLRADENVKGVVVIFRHGDYNIGLTYKNDPYKGPEHWPDGFGVLTPEGMRQSYELGQNLRAEYGHLLGEIFNRHLLYVRSTDFDKTLMSAQACLAGLFPVKESLKFIPDIAWRPIPVHTVPKMEDYMLLSVKPCPKLTKLTYDLMKTQEFSTFLKDYDWVRRHVRENSGENITDFFGDLMDIYEILRVEELRNMTLPAWTKTVYPEKLSDIVNKAFTIKVHNREMARLVTGHLLKSITDNLIAMDRNNITDRVILGSTHHTTISYLLSALNLKRGEIPPYTASLRFELVPGQTESAVRIVYEGNSLYLPNCGTSCPLSTWKYDHQTLFVDDRDHECKL